MVETPDALQFAIQHAFSDIISQRLEVDDLNGHNLVYYRCPITCLLVHSPVDCGAEAFADAITHQKRVILYLFAEGVCHLQAVAG